jgi:fluoride exporter
LRWLTTSLWIALGSALGGVLRYWCSGLIARWFGETFPWGTLIVNVAGSLLIGLIATLSAPDGRLLIGSVTRQFIMFGVLGGFTTFSSFSLQTLALAQNGEWLRAAMNVVGSVLLCLIGVWFGHALAVAINR